MGPQPPNAWALGHRRARTPAQFSDLAKISDELREEADEGDADETGT
jgi:hypothetical protein